MVEHGQIWRCAGQRLICADMREVPPEAVGEYQALVFDPPWDAPEFETVLPARQKLVFCGAPDMRRAIELHGAPTWLFVWDLRSRWFLRNRPLRAAKYCLWYGALGDYQQDAVLIGKPDGKPRTVKNHRGEHLFDPGEGNWLSDIYACALKIVRAENPHSQGKPQEWVTALLGNCTQGAIYDPCAGGGTTLLAAAALGRNATGIEIDPGHCAVILQRLQRQTGEAPQLEGSL